MDLYDPKTGRFYPTPIEDFSMWAALQRGGTNANIPLPKEFVYQWVKAITQKTAGQRKRGKDIGWNECAPGIHHYITREEAVRR